MLSGLTKHPKKIAIIAVAVLIFIAGVVFIALQAANLRDLRLQVEEEKVALNLATNEFKQRLDHRLNEQVYQNRLIVYKRMIPETPQEEEILRYFDYLAEEYNLRVLEILFAERVENAEQGYVQMPLTITMEGNYSGLVGMLKYIRLEGRAVRVNVIRISLTGSFPANIRIVLNASTFYSLSE